MGHLDNLFQSNHEEERKLESNYNERFKIYKSAIVSFYNQLEEWFNNSKSKGMISTKYYNEILTEGENSNEITEMIITFQKYEILLKPLGINVHGGFYEDGDIVGGLLLMSIHNINGPTTNLFFKTPENKWYKSDKELLDEKKFSDLIRLVLS
jgi:hypothetical protein